MDVEEYHDGRYGNPGKGRAEKKRPTKDEVAAVNARNKMMRCRRRLLEYFDPGDCFATLTYEPSLRPADMGEALKDFAKLMRSIRKEYKKAGMLLYWIRNIERGTRGAWHIHLVINELDGIADILRKAWKKGGIYITQIRLNDKVYDEDFVLLASYMTKDGNTKTKNGKTRIREASYGTSRNMPLPQPKKKRLVRWQPEVKPKKGYYISSLFEGINPVTGFKYRRYTMIRLRRDENATGTVKASPGHRRVQCIAGQDHTAGGDLR